MEEHETLECGEHGQAFVTYICCHLIEGESLAWHSERPSDDDQWPDAWCNACHRFFLAEGEWNERSEEAASIVDNVKLVCHHCYAVLQKRHIVTYI